MKELYNHIKNNNFTPTADELEAFFSNSTDQSLHRKIEEWISTNDFGDEIGDLTETSIVKNLDWNIVRGNAKETFQIANLGNSGSSLGFNISLIFSGLFISLFILSSHLIKNKKNDSNKIASINNEVLIQKILAPVLSQNQEEKITINNTTKEFQEDVFVITNNYSASILPEKTKQKKEARLERKIVLFPKENTKSIFFSKKKHTLIFNHNIKYVLQFKCVNYFDQYHKIRPFLSGTEAQHYVDNKGDFSSDFAIIQSVDELLEKAFTAFLKENYKLSIHYLNTISEHYPEDLNAKFYKALNYFELKDYSKAITTFKQCSKDSINIFKEESNWYLAKSLMGNKEKEEADYILKKIIENNGFYSEKAQLLLKKRK